MPKFLHCLIWILALHAVATSARAETLGFSLTDVAASDAGGALSVRVLDEVSLEPLEGARISISDRLDELTLNQARPALTDRRGRAKLWRLDASPMVLSVELEGFTRISIAGVRAAQATIFLKKRANPADTVMGSGQLGGWRERPGDDTVAAGLIFKSLSAMDLLHFQFQSFISPLRDTIDVFGAREIPSNLVLPAQRVSTLVGTITLNKPDYRLPVQAGAKLKLAGLQGEFKVADLLPALQGGKVGPEVLNKLKFTKVGLTGSLQENRDFREDFDTVIDLAQRHEVTVNAPPFAADVLVAAATDLMGDRQTLLPTDVKSAVSLANPSQVRTVRLAAPTQNLGQAKDILTVAVGDKGHRLTGIITDSAGRVVRPGPFLAVDELPAGRGLPPLVKMQAPASGLAAAIFEDATANLWTVYALPAAGAIDVPTAKAGAVAKYSVSRFEFGATFNERELDGTRVMRKLERFTRVSAAVAREARSL